MNESLLDNEVGLSSDLLTDDVTPIDMDSDEDLLRINTNRKQEQEKKKKKKKKKIDYASDIYLGPIQKFIKFKKIPFILLVDTLLLLLIFSNIILITIYQKPYIESNTDGFRDAFLADNFEDLMANVEGYSTQYLHSLEEFEKHINQTTRAFYNFVDNSVDAFSYKKENGNTLQPKLRTCLLAENLRNRITIKPTEGYETIASDRPNRLFFMNAGYECHEDILTMEHPIGFFESSNNTIKRDLFDRLYESKLTLEFISFDKQLDQSMPVCYNWKVTLLYNFNVRGGIIKCQFMTDYLDCDVKYDAFVAKLVSPFFYMFLVTLFFSVLKLFMSLFENVKVIIYFVRIQKLKKHNIMDASRKGGKFSISAFINNVYEEVPIVTIWTLLDVSKDICNIIGCLLFVLPTPDTLSNWYTTVTLLFLGTGALFSFASFVKYFQFWPQFYFLIVALRIATPFSIKYLIGIMPLYIAFCFAGLVWFGHYVPYFSTLDISSVTLFSAMHGDIIRDDFNMLFAFSDGYKVLGRVYLYSFIVLFITVILTMFLLITEEAYFSLWDGEDENDVNKTLNLGKYDITKKINQLDDNMDEREEQYLIDSMQAQDASMEVFFSFSLLSAIETKVRERKERALNTTEKAIFRFMQRYAAQYFKALHDQLMDPNHIEEVILPQHLDPIKPRDSIAMSFDEL